MAKKRADHGITRAQVDEFELVSAQLERFHSELLGIAKGKGNDALNAFKLGLLNNLLLRANALLGKRYEAVVGFESFDSEALPSSSDALLVVSQYLGALEKLRSDNITISAGFWQWRIDGEASGVRAAAPAKLAKKR